MIYTWVGGEGHCVPPMRCTCTACSESHGHTMHDLLGVVGQSNHGQSDRARDFARSESV